MNRRTLPGLALLLAAVAWSCSMERPVRPRGGAPAVPVAGSGQASPPAPIPASAESTNEQPSVAAARARVAKAQARVDNLEMQLTAVHNSPVPPPAVPPEEALAWEGLESVQRGIHVQQQLDRARLELLEAQKALTQALVGP